MEALIREASVGATSRRTIGSGCGACFDGSAPACLTASTGAGAAWSGTQDAVTSNVAQQAISRPRQRIASPKALKYMESSKAKIVPIAFRSPVRMPA